MRMIVLAFAATCLSSTAYAGCELATGQCSTDNYGNTYTTKRNLGGGYNTYKNGSLYSQTEQNLNGGYRETYQNGGSRSYNYNPYAPPKQANPYGFR